MKITFSYNKKIQSEYLEKVKKVVKEGFYTELNFYILPELPEKFRDRVIFLPRYKNKTESIDIIKSNELKYKIKIEKLINQLDKNKEKIEKFLYSTFSKINKNFKIQIYPVFFGSVGRYEIGKNLIYIFPRFDRTLPQTIKLVVTALVHYSNKKIFTSKNDLNLLRNKPWFEKQNLSKKIASSDKFIKLFGKCEDINDILKFKTCARYISDHKKYLKDLKIKSKEKINGNSYFKNLTTKETKLLKALINNKNKIIDYDLISDILWGEKSTEKFSLYAISKTIERIKNKLYQNGQIANLIHCQRGKGYALFD